MLSYGQSQREIIEKVTTANSFHNEIWDVKGQRSPLKVHYATVLEKDEEEIGVCKCKHEF